MTRPAWFVSGLVVASSVTWFLIGRHVAAPWIMVDELEYADLGRSFADSGRFLIRGAPAHGYGVVYPLLIAPGFRVFTASTTSYAVIKALNAVYMSMVAVPAYLLARRVLRPRAALVACALSLLVPSMLYTGEVMTENVFYPLFVGCALALVLVLEEPTVRRQAALVGLVAAAYLTRAEATAILGAVLTAPLLLAAGSRDVRLRRFLPLFGLVGAVGLVVLGTLWARNGSPLSVLGPYRSAVADRYTVGGVLRFLVYHVAELDLYLGVVGFAALLFLWLGARHGTRKQRSFAAASLALVFWVVLEVAAFASQPSISKIEERNMFYVAPLAIIALLEVIERRRLGSVQALTAAAAAAVLPCLLPFPRFVNPSATADTLAILPWWRAHDHGVELGDLRWAALLAGIAAGVAFLALSRRLAFVLPALLGVYFVAITVEAVHGAHGVLVAARGKLGAAVQTRDRDWIDRSVRRGGAVAVIYTGRESPAITWESEFFNRSITTVYDVDVLPPDPLPAVAAIRRSDGTVVTAVGPVVAQYVLASTAIDPKGRLIAVDGSLGIGLYRVDGPVVAQAHIVGLYPADTWSQRTVTYDRSDCGGGTLSVVLRSDPALFDSPQTVTARERGAPIGRASVPPDEPRRLTIALTPTAARRCAVTFTVARLASPARTVPGSADRRLLGIRFEAFSYRPASGSR
jgi:hypothetical protein